MMYYKKHINKERRSAKCFVFFLSAFVILCALVLVSATVLRPRKPRLRILTSAESNQFTYNATSPPSFNATFTIFLTIRNPNYGSFSYRTTTLSVLLAAANIARREIAAGTVGYRDTKQLSVTVNVGSVTENNLSGSLSLTSYVKLSGTVHLLKIIDVRKSVEIACDMNLDLASHAIQGIECH
ncbi:hypothetical protein Fmac_002006 [Flemingia macrophylla]|uniref:Late embryogenesis abundant protein LEA-2 subgroup domain-containing protein n=1 Tax=Flemingia macrophylla TaxID=520843 RepID=A0ABD1NIU4_9FABA